MPSLWVYLLLLLLVTAVAVPPTLSSPVPAARVWMLAWSDHKMTVLASVPASSRTECGVRCARRQGCAAASFDPSSASLPCRLLACQTGWVPLEANCYALFSNILSWTDASVACVNAAGGHLVSIHSEVENLFVDLLADLHGVPRLHLGLINDGSGQHWVDGSPLDFTKWSAGEGSDVPGAENGFLPVTASLLAAEGTAWADNSAGDAYHFMCKRERVLPAA
ncbi:C-type lectin domain family 17, member A-like [Amphibalanus amphitrite]|uniref:C-type lectin domain family 17, member A-like n=1 Tax=Amphibalanus amphitrite TaxID=1232801 RepID=UPI001C9170C5|nr:C-type lectin domain family 17, member A-like [Amphibalanus amphitrite]